MRCNPGLFAITTRDPVGYAVLSTGVYEKEAIFSSLELMRLLCPSAFDGEAIDCGANIGNHTVIFSQHFRWVHAFEPLEMLHDLLRINSRHITNISAKSIALSDHHGTCEIKVNPANLGASAIVDAEIDSCSSRGIHYSCTTLDRLYGPDTEITLIKLDLEGHEDKVICGGKHLIETQKPAVLIEANSQDIRNGQSRATSRLRAMGYRIFIRLDHGSSHRSRLARLMYIVLILFGFQRRITFKESQFLDNADYDMLVCIHDSKVRPGIISTSQELNEQKQPQCSTEQLIF